MTNTLIIAGLSVLVAVLGLIAWLTRRGHRRPVVGGRGPARYTRETHPPQHPDGPARRKEGSPVLKTAGLAALAIVLVAWVAVAALNRGEAPAEAGVPEARPAEAAADPASAPPAPPAESPTLSGALAPPPDPSKEPEPSQAPPPAPAAASAEAGVIAQPGDLLANSRAVPAAASGPAAPQATFAPATPAPVAAEEAPPEPLAEDHMLKSALDMAPKISRMEPVGRLLAPPDELPPPRLRSSAAVAAPPRLTDPPVAAPPPPLPSPPGAPFRYTVHLGSFSKPENADAVMAKLLESGYPATIEQVTLNNKVWFRVMSGVFDNHDSAAAHSREIFQRKLVTETPYVRRM
jgi:cell division protein FtsN